MLHTYARVSVGLTAVVSVVVLQHSSLLAQDVVHLCQAEIRQRIRTDYGPAAKVKYRGSATRSQQYNGREGVSGAATTRVSGRSGGISYQCVVFAPARQVESARYELTSGSLPPAASNPTEVDPRARLACQNLAIRAGYSPTQVYRTDPRGSEVVVSMRGTSRGQEYDVACTYTARAGTAVLTSQRQVGTGGEGNTSELFGRAREACEQEARRQTYEILGSGPAKVISGGVRHQLALRRGSNRYSHALCDYLSADGRALLTPGTLDGEGNPSEVFRRARDACEQEARRQTYEVLGSGPAKAMTGGVRHQLGLKRGSNRYSKAHCDYLSADGRALLAPGTPDGESNMSELFKRARQACEQEALRQTYEILGSGPAKAITGGIRHQLSLKRGSNRYSKALCDYLSADGRALLAPGTPDPPPARPR